MGGLKYGFANSAHIMNTEIRAALGTAISLWLNEALGQIKQHPDHWREVQACLHEQRDLRITYHAVNDCVTIEIDNGNNTVTEIFRDHLVQNDSGFALPETVVEQ